MSHVRSYDQQERNAARVSCFKFGRRRSKKALGGQATQLSELRARFFAAPSSSDLSVASCSLSCVTAPPDVSPLHLDIPFVAGSPASHTNTLASIERFDTPRASNYGPLSEEGKAFVAARKHSMRQEHLAAIANLNTFAKKRSSKSSSSVQGSNSSAADQGSKLYEGTDSQQPPHPTSGSKWAAAVSKAGRPEPDWTHQTPAEAEASTTTTAPTASCDADLTSGSIYGAGDWLQDGISAHRQHSHPQAAATHDQPSVGLTASADTTVNSAQPVSLPDAFQTATERPVVQGSLSSKPLIPDIAPSAQAAALHELSAAASLTGQRAGTSPARPLDSSVSTASGQHGKEACMYSDTSASSSRYTEAASLASKACSSPVANSSHQQRCTVQAQPAAAAAPKATQSHLPAETQATDIAGPAHASVQKQEHRAASPARAVESLASMESAPDESLIAEDDGQKVSEPRAGASSAAPSKSRLHDAPSAITTLSDEEVVQLQQELAELQQQPRAQMTSQQLGRYLEIRIKLGRAGSLTASKAQKLPATPALRPGVPAEGAMPVQAAPTTTKSITQNINAGKTSSSTASAAPSKVDRPKAHRQITRQPAPRQKAARENQSENASSGAYVPAYMRSTASVKAKDARDQQAKMAAARTALTEKKWNRA